MNSQMCRHFSSFLSAWFRCFCLLSCFVFNFYSNGTSGTSCVTSSQTSSLSVPALSQDLLAQPVPVRNLLAWPPAYHELIVALPVSICTL